MSMSHFIAAVSLLCGFHRHDFIGDREQKLKCMEDYVNCAVKSDKDKVDSDRFKHCKDKLKASNVELRSELQAE